MGWSIFNLFSVHFSKYFKLIFCNYWSLLVDFILKIFFFQPWQGGPPWVPETKSKKSGDKSHKKSGDKEKKKDKDKKGDKEKKGDKDKKGDKEKHKDK